MIVGHDIPEMTDWFAHVDIHDCARDAKAPHDRSGNVCYYTHMAFGENTDVKEKQGGLSGRHGELPEDSSEVRHLSN